MTLSIANSVWMAHPKIRKRLEQVAELCVKHDPDIELDNLYVQVVKRRSNSGLHGSSWGSSRIKLYIADQDKRMQISRWFAHELRHTAQDRRGELFQPRGDISPHWGDNTKYEERDEETDAAEFADMIVKLIKEESRATR